MADKIAENLLLNYGLAGALVAMNAMLVVFIGRWMMGLIAQQRTDFLGYLQQQEKRFIGALKDLKREPSPVAGDRDD